MRFTVRKSFLTVSEWNFPSGSILVSDRFSFRPRPVLGHIGSNCRPRPIFGHICWWCGFRPSVLSRVFEIELFSVEAFFSWQLRFYQLVDQVYGLLFYSTGIFE